MKRRILIILMVGAFGAVLNVVVAWGVLLYWPVTGYSATRDLDRWRAFAQRHGLDLSRTLHNDHLVTGAGFAVNKVDYVPFALGGTEMFGTGTFLVRTECGWPARSLHAWVFEHRDYCHCIRMDRRKRSFGSGADDCLPMRPIWPGFIINTLVYAILLWLLFAGPFAARRMLRRRRGLCATCAYPVGVSPVCTECGAALRRS